MSSARHAIALGADGAVPATRGRRERGRDMMSPTRGVAACGARRVTTVALPILATRTTTATGTRRGPAGGTATRPELARRQQGRQTRRAGRESMQTGSDVAHGAVPGSRETAPGTARTECTCGGRRGGRQGLIRAVGAHGARVATTATTTRTTSATDIGAGSGRATTMLLPGAARRFAPASTPTEL